MTIDMSKYVELYVVEAQEHLASLARELVRFETQRSAALVDELFRHAHSLKGMAASMGYEPSVALAHHMENVFEIARKLPERLDSEALDALLQSTDALRKQVECVFDSRPLPDFSERVELLRKTVSRMTGHLSREEPKTEEKTDSRKTPAVVGQPPVHTVRVKAEWLDDCLDMVGDLLLSTSRIRELGKSLPASQQPVIDEAAYKLFRLARKLHDNVMTARMTPLSMLTQRLPRACRDVARKENKQVELMVTGTDIELDRSLVEELSEPILHWMRNGICHGIETPEVRTARGKAPTGMLRVSVRREQEWVVMDLEDDGQGMQTQKLRELAVRNGHLSLEEAQKLSEAEAWMLCCLPGLSTAKEVSDLSGRGVGMDVVKRAADKLGGRLEISSVEGQGTSFTLRVPMTVAVAHLLLVEVGTETFGLPLNKVMGVFEFEPSQVQASATGAWIDYKRERIQVHALHELLQVASVPRIGRRSCVVMECEGQKVALWVDALRGHEEMVLKSLSKPLDSIAGLGAVALLGNGRPVFVLDVPRLLAA